MSWDFLLFVQVWPVSWIYLNNTNNNFTNDYFTIHGIWPDNTNGPYPEYCAKEYLNLTTLADVLADLAKYWTDFTDPYSLIKHEYEKHWTCLQDDPLLDTAHKYFSMGLSLRNKINIYALLRDCQIIPSNSVKYETAILANIISNYTGHRIVITCDDNSVLNEIRFCYDTHIQPIDCCQKAIDEQCPEHTIWYRELV